jgi:predicted MFS family arabinose efflux permease
MAFRAASRAASDPPTGSGLAAAPRQECDYVRPLLTVWLGWLALMTSANLAAPLYAVYAQRFGFSSLVLTAIFATYAFVLVPSLILFGRLSDAVGRRPVMLAGIVAGCVGLALFAAAQGIAWLFVARVFQGLAVGMIGGPAMAALVELDAKRDEQRPALLAGLAQAGGSAAGPLVAGVLAQWGPAPRQLPYLVLLALTLVAGAFMVRLPEPEGAEREPWRPQWPRVPEELRAPFARVSLSAAVAWASVALYLSIVPSYASTLLKTHDLALLGALSAVALAASCVAQIAAQRRRIPLRAAQAAGLAVLAAGLVLLVVASPLASLAVLLPGAVLAGAGHGVVVLAAQDELNGFVPQERRGEVTAAFIACIYALVATAVVAAGLLDEALSLAASVGAVCAVLAVIAAAAAVWQRAA